MKTRSFSLMALLLLLVASACSSSNSNDNILLAVGSPSIDYHTDWAINGLLGPVESVTYENGDSKETYHFTPKGKLVENSVEKTRFKGRVRTDATTYMTNITYTFDELGRVVTEVASDYDGTYEYEGENYFPVRTSFSYCDEGGEPETETREFTYKPGDFDDHGNWLVRTINGKEKQKRVITYHVDPYDLGKVPHYNSPKEVVEAMMKAEKNKDALAYLKTIEYSARKRYELTQEFYQKNLDNRKEENQIRSYRVHDEVEEHSNYTDVFVTVTTKDGKTTEWAYSVYQGDDGYWYNGLMGSSKK